MNESTWLWVLGGVAVGGAALWYVNKRRAAAAAESNAACEAARQAAALAGYPVPEGVCDALSKLGIDSPWDLPGPQLVQWLADKAKTLPVLGGLLQDDCPAGMSRVGATLTSNGYCKCDGDKVTVRDHVTNTEYCIDPAPETPPVASTFQGDAYRGCWAWLRQDAGPGPGRITAYRPAVGSLPEQRGWWEWQGGRVNYDANTPGFTGVSPCPAQAPSNVLDPDTGAVITAARLEELRRSYATGSVLPFPIFGGGFVQPTEPTQPVPYFGFGSWSVSR